jgi:hypothetical protein
VFQGSLVGSGGNRGTKEPPHMGLVLSMDNSKIKYFYGKLFLSAVDSFLIKKRLFY